MTRDPEIRESFERYLETAAFSPETEKRLLDLAQRGKEKFPNIISCPNSSCKNPLSINVTDEAIELLCGNCGWNKILKR